MFDIMQIRTDVCKRLFAVSEMRLHMKKLNFESMSYKELITYKRRIRRKIVFRRRVLATAFLLITVLIMSFSVKTLISKADSQKEQKFKYYSCEIVSNNDTVWTLAHEYYDEDMYRNIDSYIKEVKEINHLNDRCDIYTGQSIVMPYYSSAYIK